MLVLLHLFAAAGMVTALVVVLKGRRAVRGTTLVVPWAVLLLALLLGMAVGLATRSGLATAGMADRLWYLVAVVLLCPGIAVLGARRPGAHAWTWFVLLPLVLVLTVPVLAAGSSHLNRPLELEAPPLLGFALVLLMGTGNYFGTRFAVPAFGFAVAPLLLVLPCLSEFSGHFAHHEVLRPAAAAWLGLVAYGAARAGTKSRDAASPLERLWFDVRDHFGTVWAKRLADRVNDALAAQQLPARLDHDGLAWTAPDPAEPLRQRSRETAEHTLRWLLKRFVTPEWIDSHLHMLRLEEIVNGDESCTTEPLSPPFSSELNHGDTETRRRRGE